MPLSNCVFCNILRPLASNQVCRVCLKERHAKECTHCKSVKDYGDFYNSQSKCKECYSRKNLKYTLKKHKISQGDYDKMLASQDGRCAICKLEKRLVIDHCHSSGKVRGLLCTTCSTSLGGFFDSPFLLNNACSYLRSESTSYLSFLSEQEIQIRDKIQDLLVHHKNIKESAIAKNKEIKENNKKMTELKIPLLLKQKIELEITINHLKTELRQILDSAYRHYNKQQIDSRYGIRDELFK
jgi:hypothetical protein